MIDVYNDIFRRELQKLETEILAFRDEAHLWIVYGDIKNSAGNLCLHLCGNLQHFIGVELGKSDYVRNRESEFNAKNSSRELLIKEINNSITAVELGLRTISEDDLQKIYPRSFLGKEVTTAYFLIHLISHFDYHLGQINYLRRMTINS